MSRKRFIEKLKEARSRKVAALVPTTYLQPIPSTDPRGHKGHAKKSQKQKATGHPWRKPFYYTAKSTAYEPQVKSVVEY